MEKIITSALVIFLLFFGTVDQSKAQNLNSLKNKAKNKVKQTVSSPVNKEEKPQGAKPVKINDENAARILTSIPWRYDAEKLEESFQAEYGSMNESSMSADQRAAKEEAENQMNVMKDLRLHFGEDGKLALKFYGSEQASMQWNVSAKTLTMSQDGQEESFDILKLTENEIHIREQKTKEESFLLAEGYNRPSSKEGKKDDSPSAPVSLDFDYSKNQLTYAEEFLKENTTIYKLELDDSRKKYFFDTYVDPFGKNIRTIKKHELFKQNELLGDDRETRFDSPHFSMRSGKDNTGKPEYRAFYTNYDKGPSAWVTYSSKNQIVLNHGEGKKYTEQDALDYSGFMFFDGIAFYADYKRFDGGKIYRMNYGPGEIWVTDKSVANKITPDELAEKIAEYLIKGENEPDGFILGLANQLHEEDRALNSIEGKEVKSIKIKTANGETKMPVNYAIGLEFEATLADGTVMSTAKKAWMEDYEIIVEGAKIDNEGKLMCYQFYNGNDFDVNQVLDKATVTIKSKYHPDVAAAKIELPVDYSQPKMLNLNYAGNPWDGQTGGASLVLEVKKVKNTVDGSDLLEYRMRYKRDAHWYQIVRVKPENSVFLDCSGFSHGNKTSGDGKDGGDGGDIRLIVDPSAAGLNFDYSNKGAKAQPPKSSAYAYGQNGRDGTFEKKVQNITW
jgi:hypothetical protein